MSNMTTDLSRRENATMEEGTKTNETKNTFRELIESESDGSHVYSTTLGGIRRRLTGIQVAWIYLFWADELNAINRQNSEKQSSNNFKQCDFRLCEIHSILC